VPKKGLEPPHPCGYMDLNHARLPIPPLRPVTYFCAAAATALMEETATSILQGEWLLSNLRRQSTHACPCMTKPKKPAPPAARRSKHTKQDEVAELRTLAHDLSNSLEAILQAAYLLGQAKLDESSKRWAHLIDISSQDAARINREIRKHLRALSED
jgi:nitrogen-specific signal transduction histidine kinase